MEKFKLHKSFSYFVTLILLQLILGVLLYNAFDTPEGNSFEWTGISIYWIVLNVITLGLIFLEVSTKIKDWILPISIIVGYSIFIIVLLNSSIFSWIPRVKSASVNYELIPLYLTIPGIFHAMLDIILKRFRPDGKFKSNLHNFLLAISVPISLYLLVIIAIPLFRGTHYLSFSLNNFFNQIVICIAIALFLFFFLRMILGNIIGKNTSKKDPFMVTLFGLLFPILGLCVHYEFPLFGNFNFILLYITVIVNAIGLFLLLNDAVSIKFIGFLLTCIGLPYVLYFFIIFLPYIPLSFIALIVFGAGILMLTPTVLFLVQFQLMVKNYVEIVKTYRKEKVLSLSVFCVLILPISFALFCHHHKTILTEVVAETNQFDASNHEYTDFDVDKLAYIFEQMKKNRRRLSFDNPEKRLPLLSIYYDWYVFDNLQLSRQKTAEIKRLYLGNQKLSFPRYTPPETLKAAITYTSNTEYVADGDFYKTKLDLSITNLDSKNLREFRTEFLLPKDVFITDYYLDIEDRRTYGILAEKRAANWIYEQITNQRRDPGILQYLYDDVLSLKIYPFKGNETRTSGFTLYHRNPVHFTMNETPIAIDVKPLAQNVTELNNDAFYIPSSLKKELPKVSAPIQYYFIVDNTTEGDEHRKKFQEDYSSLSKTITDNSQILYVDADVNWEKQTNTKNSGFNFVKAVSQIQFAHSDQKSIPFVVVYGGHSNRFLGKYTTWELQHMFPYQNIVEHKDWNQQAFPAIEFGKFTRNGKSNYVPIDGKPSLVTLDTSSSFEIETTANPYLNALQLRLFHELNDLNPKRQRTHWLQALRQSFSQNILTHSTTYISLETKEQEARLLKKQEEIMNAAYGQKVGTELQPMSEPYFWILLLLFLIYVTRQQFLKHQTQKT